MCVCMRVCLRAVCVCVCHSVCVCVLITRCEIGLFCRLIKTFSSFFYTLLYVSFDIAQHFFLQSIGDRKFGNHSVKRDGTQIAELDYLARQYEALLIRHRAAILSALNKERLS